ncbi:MAG: trypsin-like peptidase domain-containing protein [Bdellovibrionota bacterium]
MMKKWNFLSTLLCSSLLTAGCAKEAFTGSPENNIKTELSQNVIYGSDGRLDVYQSNDALKLLSDSTVALIKNGDLSEQGASTLIAGKSFAQSYQLCSSEKFREQNTSAFCSGALVGPDTVITAGHCITSQSDCVGTSFVFGYTVKSAGVLPTLVSSNEVYRCREIVHRVLQNTGEDYAVIKLDRAVNNHAVLKIRRSGEASVGDPLLVIGHPAGLPTKITTGGKVRSTANSSHLVTNLDTYGGNSGSAVFNALTSEIEGILVRGEEDFVSQGGCNVSKVCTDDSCRGEDVTRISVLRQYIPQTNAPPVSSTPPVANSETFSSAQVVAVPDNNTAGVSSSLKVTSAPGARKVLISVNLTHTYIGDLVIKVVASDGKSVTLHSRSGGGADNIVKTYDATAALGSVANVGTYKLVVQDLAKHDTGSLKSWSVKFQ